jgi:hypothetical protein
VIGNLESWWKAAFGIEDVLKCECIENKGRVFA